MPVRRCDDQTYTLATGLSATGAGVRIPGGEYAFLVDGTATGATLSLQMQTPAGVWSDVAVWDNSVVKSTTLPYILSCINLPAGLVRMAATGGTPTGLNATLQGLG